MNDFEGRIAVVTGAARGIGAATTRLMGERGAAVVLIDKDPDALATMSPTLADAGVEHLAITCDHSVESQVEGAVQAVRDRFGRCDVLVNNASMVRFELLEHVTLDEWEETIAVNLRGYFLCMRGFGRMMLEQGSGSIVNIASPGAAMPIPAGGACSAALAARVMLAKQAALEWGHRGIRVNTVCPGQTSTPGVEQWHHDDALAQRLELVPLGRLADPIEQARFIAFVCSDQASFLTGQVIYVDGGLMQSLMSMIPHPGEKQVFARQMGITV